MASTTSSMFRASRPLFRQSTFGGGAPRFANRQNFYQQGGRRWQSTTANQQQGWFKRMWESEIGFKTVHFWAPVMKWALVLAGISDFARPAEKLSFTQNFALTCTGLIWTRWCLIIKPKNYLLAAVNFFLALVGITQVTRIGLHESSKKKSAAALVEDAKDDVKENVKDAKDAVKAVKP